MGLALLAAACGSEGSTSSAEAGGGDAGEISGTITIGAIPDQDPELLQRTYGIVADYLETEVPGLTVAYAPVTDYQAAVSAFRVGDLDLVWFGGLTGVQARLEVDGATAVAQRDIDAEFTSVFVTSTDWLTDNPVEIAAVADLASLAGARFTFGSESSTSGRLMPQSFLETAGLDVDADFDGPPGFSGSHDATIEQVAAGTFEVGALNSQVWDSRLADGSTDTSQVVEIFRTPTYFDYHWVAQPGLDDRLGEGALDAVVEALTSLDASDPAHAEILELFGAGSFIETNDGNYADIERVGRAAGLINATS